MNIIFLSQRFNAYKHHWSETRKGVILEVNAAGIDQIEAATNKVLCSYYYRDIEGFTQVIYPGGVVAEGYTAL